MLWRNPFASETPLTHLNLTRASVHPDGGTISTAAAMQDMTFSHLHTPQRKRTSDSHLSPSAMLRATSYSPSNPYATRAWRPSEVLDSPCASPHSRQDGTPRRRNGHKRQLTFSSIVDQTIRDVRWASNSGDWSVLTGKKHSVDTEGGMMIEWDLWDFGGKVCTIVYQVVFWASVVIFILALFGIGATPDTSVGEPFDRPAIPAGRHQNADFDVSPGRILQPAMSPLPRRHVVKPEPTPHYDDQKRDRAILQARMAAGQGEGLEETQWEGMGMRWGEFHSRLEGIWDADREVR